jgi:hypothetical protein
MSPLAWFVVAHFVGDYLIQTEYEALNKAQGRFWNRALVVHCLKYTACFIPALLAYQVSLIWLLPVLATHLLFDRRWLIVLWRKYINRNSDEGIKQTFWLTIMVDQIFHVLVIVAIVCLAF